MKKTIAVLLTVILSVSALTVPAWAASPSWDWSACASLWKSWFAQAQAESPAESEAPVESAAPEETEVPEETEPVVEYTIRYDANGGIWWSLNSSPATKNIKYVYVQAGDSTKALNAPTRGGYAFRGWQAEDGTVYGAKEAFVPECNMNLKALWECTMD